MDRLRKETGMTEQSLSFKNPNEPPGHKIISIADEGIRTRIKCECGAEWTVMTPSYKEGLTHIEDHWRFARKKPTRAD
jgi:hypothetical protein